ncbi:MAG: potassium transporter TrkH, partial [Planctomycetia bacterium]|nr:potassium transporter TrkH [Planctomycetia bacterium]
LLLLGQRLSLHHEALAGGSLDEAPRIEPRRLVLNVVRFTLQIEGLGAVLLYLLWLPRLGWREAAWPALFHSVSAFCNAGFSTFSDSLLSFQESPVSLGVIMVLIVAGGIGFLTLEESYLYCGARRQKRGYRMSLHSRLVLATTAALLIVGGLAFALMEWHGLLGKLPVVHRPINALFMSVTVRTAGFNNVDFVHASESSNFVAILLMMIGGSPGSTAGGVKTTTFALLGILAWSRLLGHEVPCLAGRSLRQETTDRAVGLFVVAAAVVTTGILALMLFEEGTGGGRFLDRMFEAVSAFNTVGLSTGQTPQLSTGGRWTVIVLMFLGRIGPFTLAAALARRAVGAERFRYAYEEVMVG